MAGERLGISDAVESLYMENASEVDSSPRVLTDVVLALPFEADLKIVVLVDQVLEPLEKMSALLACQPVDILGESTEGEDALPASDWVRANHRVHGLQVIAYVLG